MYKMQQRKPATKCAKRSKSQNQISAKAKRQAKRGAKPNLPPMPGQGAAAKRGSEDGLCPPQRRGLGGSAPIKQGGIQ